MHDPTLQARHGRERRGRGKCDCCPYGYHLDLDFVRYCEKVSASGLLPGQRATLHRPPTRKKRESRESLLGLTSQQVSPTEGGRPEPTDRGKIYDRQASEDLEKAVLDFEKIFNSSTRSQSNDERVSPLPRVEPSVDVKYHTLPGDRLTQPLDLLKLNGTNNEIRHQMAASLCRIRQLEEEVKAIPNLQNQLKKLRWENRRLLKLLDNAEKKKDKVGESGEKRTIGVGYRVLQREVGTCCRVELRSVSTQGVPVNSGSNVGLSCRVETKSVGTEGEVVKSYRDVGLSCQVETKSVGTEGEAVRSYRDVGLSCQVETISVGTVSEVEPRRDIGLSCRFPTFDAAVQHRGPAITDAASQAQLALLLRPDRHVGVQVNTHAKKAFTSHVSVQHDSDSKTLMAPTSSTDTNTQTDLKAPEKKHIAVQNKPPISDIGTSTNYRTFEHSTQTVKSTSRDFGLTVNTLLPKAHNNIGVNTSPPEKSRQYTVGTSTDNTSSHDRFTQCLRSASRDIGLTVNLTPDKIPQKTVACNTASTEDRKPITTSRLTDTSGLVKVTEMAVNTSVETSASEVSPKKALSRERLHLNLNSPTGRDKSKIMSHIPIYQHSSGQSRRDERGRGGGDEERHGEEEAGGLRKTSHHHQPPPSPSPPVSPLQPVLSTPLDKPYQKKEPSKEMKGAMKVLHDNLLKSPSGEFPRNLRNAVNIVQQEWFKVSSQADANPLDVEDYLDCFEEMSVPLLEYIVNMTDVSGNTAMHYAVSNGNFDVVSILLDSKVCNINKLNRAGYTCIMLVALTKVKSEADRQVVRRLFQMADVNIRARQDNDWTGFHGYVWTGFHADVAMETSPDVAMATKGGGGGKAQTEEGDLIMAKARVIQKIQKCAAKHGQTALMLAVSHGRIDTVELLLESGADINIQDEDGSTALMCAAEHGHIDIVKLLLAQSDCDLSLTDLDGNTALNIAMEAGNRDIGVLLYAQEHFSRGASPMGSLKMRRAKSATPTLKTRTPTPPNSTLEHSL